MGELLYSAPFYQNVRKHTTNIGEILCTGKGCVACDPEKNGNENIVKILGDIDTVNFELGSKNAESRASRALKTRARPTTASGCYGDNVSERRSGKKKIKKKTKKRAERSPSSEVKTATEILVTDLSQNYEKKIAEKKEKIETSKLSMKKNFIVKNVPVGKQGARIDSSKYLTVPSRSKILPLKQKEARKTKSMHEKESGKGLQVIKNTTFSERPLYHTFPRAHRSIRQGKYRNKSTEENTSFLEMLKTSQVGIYESKMMKVNTSSVWIEKILQQGVKEEQLLPGVIPQVSERKSGDGSELKTTDKITQTPLTSNATTTRILPRVSFNGKVEVRGGESVLIIEHEHESMKEKDKVLYRVGFALEELQVKSTRNFPKVSIIDIADSLGEFVEMGVIKVIQRRNKRWLILVEGKVNKDFLLQNGVILGGRHFELIELKTF